MYQLLINFLNLINPNQILIINIASLIILGLIFTFWSKNFSKKFLKKIHFNDAINRTGLDASVKKFEPNIDILTIITNIIQIFFIILFSMFLCEAINLHALSELLTKIILYYPNILISIIIFTISIYAIDYTQKIVIGTKTSKKITYSRFLAKIIEWSIRILTFLAIVYQLQIVPQLIVVIFIGFALAISLAIGISVGLAAKKPISHLLKEIHQTIAKFF